MPAMASITINDGKATPVAHTFAPVRTDGSNAKLANRNASIPKGFETLEVNVREAQSADGAYRITGSIVLPTTGTLPDTSTGVLRSSKVDFAFSCAQLSTAQERKDLAALASNLFAHALFKQVIENVEPIY